MKPLVSYPFLVKSLCLIFLCLPGIAAAFQQGSSSLRLQGFLSVPLEKNEVGFFRLGPYSNVILRVSDKTVLFDPAGIPEDLRNVLNRKKIDLILYTHSHWDHFAKPTALMLFEGSQPYIAIEPGLGSHLAKEIPEDKLIVAAPGESFTAGDIRIDAIKGEHIGPITLFRITIDGISVFHGGDSAYVPLKALASHLAFVPAGYPSPTCKPEYAFQMTADLAPLVAVPMHGRDSELQVFKQLVDEKLPGTSVVIAPPHTIQKISIPLHTAD